MFDSVFNGNDLLGYLLFTRLSLWMACYFLPILQRTLFNNCPDGQWYNELNQSENYTFPVFGGAKVITFFATTKFFSDFFEIFLTGRW